MDCEAEIQTLLDAQNYDAVYAKFAKKSSSLLEAVGPKDIEKVYNLLIAIVSQAKQEELADLVPSIVNPIVSSGEENATIKLKVLSNLYNSIETTSHIRYSVFVAIVQLASTANELDTVVPVLPQLESFFVSWDVDLDEKRRLILLLSDVLGQVEEFKNLSYEYLIQYLKTYQSSKSTAAYPKQVQETALKAVHQALTLSFVTNFSDLAALGPVQSLKTAHADLLSLVQIFVSGDVKAFKAFVKKHAGFVSKNELDEEKLLKKIRLLTLSSVACKYVDSTSDMPFSVVSDALEIDVADVEEWVVTGIRSGLIDGRIDQVQKVVCVSRATHREFSAKEWDLLSDKLVGWSNNLKDILQVLQNAKAVASAAQQQQQQ
ncbi:PCI-domain-containing protein [Rhizoclosmatium globosum]|uniref:Eukaryotic translation initiation factor 3 subunit M n=1 Tax=Rhizoclosmatium globosum TaxID=329046 RepID=A0A1Y2CA92_9FUNG|nr:PCI-domain-containing protein [Rhizoclosmatium globosum]|eukprot:ORY43958.1 PCI-domain-containing protein [Rhizoclosmatium globosum]